MFKIKRETINIEPYRGFYDESMLNDPFLDGFANTDIWLTLFGFKVKLLHTYRLTKNRFFKGKII